MFSSRIHFGNEGLKSGKQVLSETPGHSASVGVPRSLLLLEKEGKSRQRERT